MTEPTDAAFEALLEFLKRTRGIDFTGYKRTSLQRRFRRRMEVVGSGSFGDYLDYLEVTPEEAQKLALAMQVGQLSLALRNQGSIEQLRARTIRVNDLINDKPVKANPPARSEDPTVRVRRGINLSVAPVGG